MRNNKGQFIKGFTPWNKGRQHSKESINKMSLSKVGKHYSRSTEFKKGLTPWNKGNKNVGTLKKKCTICESEFLWYPYLERKGKGKYCSRRCCVVASRKGLLRNCKTCMKELLVKPSELHRKFYCSRQCKNTHPVRLCVICGEVAKRYLYDGVSKGFAQHCQNCLDAKGKGLTPIKTLVRTGKKNNEWRLSVFKRDGFKCTVCGCVESGKLQADHIYPFWAIFERHKITTVEEANNCPQLWDISNGRTLCVDCHKKTPTYGKGAWKYVEVIQ